MSDRFLTYWFKGLDQALAELDDMSTGTLMSRCGQACSDSYSKQVYMAEYRAADTLDGFIDRLNGRFGEMAARRTGPDMIEVVYTRCACDLVRNGYVSNPKLCLCSLKSLQHNWEAILGKNSVACRLEQSILGGGDCCRFTVKINPEEE